MRDDSVESGEGTSYWTSTAVPAPTVDQCGPWARVSPYQVNFGQGNVSAFPEDCPNDPDATPLRVRLVRDAR
jgi:hypothetical protein